MRYYPVYLNLQDRKCLVVGAGEVGSRKIASLLDMGAGHVTIIDTRPAEGPMADIAARENVEYSNREFREDDLDGKWLVIACTSSEEVNWRISNLCNERGILCNIVDQPEKCNFIVPAVVRQGDLTLAISTGGRSPALAKHIRRELQDTFGSEYGRLLMLMGRLRPHVLELGWSTPDNTKLFRSLITSGLLEALESGDLTASKAVLTESLPEQLHQRIPELLDGLV